MPTLTISIGGSIILQENNEIEYLKNLSELLISISKRNKLFIVVGGGALARDYQKLVRELGAGDSFLDNVGIAATRMNARLLIAALNGNSNSQPVSDFDEAITTSRSHPIVVMGGTEPGHTTDAVAAMLGERVGADRFINATVVDGVYTKDPNKYQNAVKIEKMTPNELWELTKNSEHSPGQNVVIDSLAARIIERSGIPTYVVKGTDLEALKDAMIGKGTYGTVIK